jgi:hypothetical protein
MALVKGMHLQAKCIKELEGLAGCPVCNAKNHCRLVFFRPKILVDRVLSLRNASKCWQRHTQPPWWESAALIISPAQLEELLGFDHLSKKLPQAAVSRDALAFGFPQRNFELN